MARCGDKLQAPQNSIFEAYKIKKVEKISTNLRGGAGLGAARCGRNWSLWGRSLKSWCRQVSYVALVKFSELPIEPQNIPQFASPSVAIVQPIPFGFC